jgi:hypothetical protein
MKHELIIKYLYDKNDTIVIGDANYGCWYAISACGLPLVHPMEDNESTDLSLDEFGEWEEVCDMECGHLIYLNTIFARVFGYTIEVSMKNFSSRGTLKTEKAEMY